MKFLDTNILLRYFLGDHKLQSPAAKSFLLKVEKGEEKTQITPLVIAEIVYFLEKNRFSKRKIVRVLEEIISLPTIFLEGKEYFSQIFDLYVAKNIDFVDAYHAVFCAKNNIREIVSFDRDFDKTKIIKRIEPK